MRRQREGAALPHSAGERSPSPFPSTPPRMMPGREGLEGYIDSEGFRGAQRVNAGVREKGGGSRKRGGRVFFFFFGGSAALCSLFSPFRPSADSDSPRIEKHLPALPLPPFASASLPSGSREKTRSQPSGREKKEKGKRLPAKKLAAPFPPHVESFAALTPRANAHRIPLRRSLFLVEKQAATMTKPGW